MVQATRPPGRQRSKPESDTERARLVGLSIPNKPTWMRDVQPIFQQYANLYPVMRPILDLANYADVVSKLSILKNVFERP